MAENQVLCEKKTIFFNSGVEKSFFCGYFIYNALTVPSIHARMAESADATDLKSVAHKAYGFKSRSGYHFLAYCLREGFFFARIRRGRGVGSFIQTFI